jgi:chromosome segregation ATPase
MSCSDYKSYDITVLKNKIEDLENQNDSFLLHVDYYYKKIKKLEKENKVLKTLIDLDLSKEIISLRNRNIFLESKVKKFDDNFESEMEQRDEEIQLLEVTNFNFENENNVLNEKLQQTETEINLLKSEKESMQEAIDSLRKTNETLTQSIEEKNASWFPKLF